MILKFECNRFLVLISFIFLFMALSFADGKNKDIFSIAPKNILEIKSVKILKPKKKKILIFNCRGGGGHLAVSKAMNDYLKNDYDIVTVNMFGDVLSSIDTISTFTLGKFTGEDFYNFCLNYRWSGLAGKFMNLGSWAFRWRKESIEKLIYDYVFNINPDLILSVIPLINFALLNVSKKLNLPLIVLTNDLDSTNYINGICDPNYKKFYYTLAFDDQDMKNKISCANIPKNQIRSIGFPLRPEFFTEKNKEKLKKEFNIPENKSVIMVLMGGAGSMASYRYVKTLSRSKLPLHIIVCLGRSENLKEMIEKIKLPDNISITIFGFTQRIADLMAASDLLITKPGPGSVCESIACNLPMLLDQTSGTLWWEEMNIDLVKKYNLGDVVIRFRDLNNLIAKYFSDPEYIKSIKNNMKLFNKNTFEKNIKNLISEALVSDSQIPNLASFEINFVQRLF